MVKHWRHCTPLRKSTKATKLNGISIRICQWLHMCCCRSSHNRLPVKYCAILWRSRQRRESRCRIRKWSLVQQRKKRQRDMVPGWNALFPEMCKKSQIDQGLLHNLIYVSSIFLWCLNHKESIGGNHCCDSLRTSLARGTFNHSRKKRINCYCPTVPCSAVLTFGECLWHALHAKFVDPSLVYLSPELWKNLVLP